jgi:hypothetical protein
MKSAINTLSDADVKTRIGIAFATRPRITWHDISATVHDGIVTLRGEVPTAYDRHLVVAITRHVAGVLTVDDQLVIVEASRRRIFHGRHSRRAGASALVVAMAVLTGCGGGEARVPVHPAHGAVQFRGQPAVGAFVSLHPKDGADNGAPSPRATVGPDGNFKFTTYDGDDGAPAGDYVLTVLWYKPVRQGNDLVGGPNVLPRKYAAAATSDLQIRIAAGENYLKPIQLR